MSGKDNRTAKIIPNTHKLSLNSLNNPHCHSHSRTTHNYYGGCTIGDPAVEYELNIDAMSHTHSIPKITNSHYYIYGSQTHIMGYLKKPNKKIAPKKVASDGDQTPRSNSEESVDPHRQIQVEIDIEEPESNELTEITEAEIVAVGSKTCYTNEWYYVLTVLFGCCLILPFLLLCCVCWKKRFFPKYEVDGQLYQLLGVFLRKVPSCRVLRLSVVDNAFNGQKAKVLEQSLSGFDLSHFQFTNLALPCNHHQSEADSFISNMQVVKSVAKTTVLKWGHMIA